MPDVGQAAGKHDLIGFLLRIDGVHDPARGSVKNVNCIGHRIDREAKPTARCEPELGNPRFGGAPADDSEGLR